MNSTSRDNWGFNSDAGRVPVTVVVTHQNGETSTYHNVDGRSIAWQEVKVIGTNGLTKADTVRLALTFEEDKTYDPIIWHVSDVRSWSTMASDI